MPDILSTGNGGWVRYESDDLDPSVFVRFEDRDGRLVPVDLFLPGESGLSAGLLRRVPLGRIEAWVNEEGLAEHMRVSVRLPAVDLRRAASHFSTTFGSAGQDNWVRRMLRAQIAGSDEPTPPMRPLAEFGKRGHSNAAPVDARLKVPSTRDKGDEFYRDVAAVYQQLAAQTRAIAPAIQEANAIENVTTVHRWIKEARRRGFLPRGQVGKVG